MNKPTTPTRTPLRRSFTLVELIVAGIITTFVLGSISTSLATLARAKNSSRQRLEAHLRADTALEKIRRDVVSFIRNDDLFFSRFYLFDGAVRTPNGMMDRDEILIFSNQLRQLRTIDYYGEGTESEMQYRVEEAFGDPPVLWQRRDPIPDKYPRGGGIATPMTDSVIGLNLEAYDGFQWFDDWDSDFDGMPYAVRITVTASGDSGDVKVYESSIATLRTIVAFDRILLPQTNLMALYDAEHADDEAEEDEEGFDPNAPSSLNDLNLPGGFGNGLQSGDGNSMQFDSNGRPSINQGNGTFGDPNDPRLQRLLRGMDDNHRPVFVAPGSSTSSSNPNRTTGGNQ